MNGNGLESIGCFVNARIYSSHLKLYYWKIQHLKLPYMSLEFKIIIQEIGYKIGYRNKKNNVNPVVY